MKAETGKLIISDAFLPAAEYFNLSLNIDKWVINKLFELLTILHHQKGKTSQYVINLPGHSISDNGLLELIIQQFEDSSLSPENICFEITETVAISNLTNTMRFISFL